MCLRRRPEKLNFPIWPGTILLRDFRISGDTSMESSPHSEMVEVLRELYDHKDQFKDEIGKFSGRLSYKDSLLIWQYVRFNPLYQSMYDSLHNSITNTLDPYGIELSDVDHNEFAELGGEWCLFPKAIDYRQERLPQNYFFEYKALIQRLYGETEGFAIVDQEDPQEWLN